jgi:hypothetical protein
MSGNNLQELMARSAALDARISAYVEAQVSRAAHSAPYSKPLICQHQGAMDRPLQCCGLISLAMLSCTCEPSGLSP